MKVSYRGFDGECHREAHGDSFRIEGFGDDGFLIIIERPTLSEANEAFVVLVDWHLREVLERPGCAGDVVKDMSYQETLAYRLSKFDALAERPVRTVH